MNTNKKLIILSLAFLLCITIGGTLAFSTSVEDDKNVLSTGRVSIEQLEKEREKDNSGKYTNILTDFTQEKNIDPAYYVNDKVEYVNTSLELNGVTSQNRLYANSVKNVVDKFVFIKNIGKTDAYIRTIIAFECPEGFDYSLIKANLNESENIKWDHKGYVKLGEHRYYFLAATYQEALVADELSMPSLLQVLLVPKTTNEDMDLLGDTFDILVKTQAAQIVEGQTSEQVLNKVFGEMSNENLNKWFDLRPKNDVENFEQLTTEINQIAQDSIINIKDDIDSNGNGIWIENKVFEVNGNGYELELAGKVGNYNYNYAPIIVGGEIIFNDVNIISNVGGLAILDGAKLTFNGGGIKVNTENTSSRYNFYVAGESSSLVINSGTFSFNQYKKRSYIWTDGASVVINGGTFGPRPNHQTDVNRPFIITGAGEIIIKGGTFGFDLSKPESLGYSDTEKVYTIAEGYKVIDNNNGTWSVIPE